MFTEVVADLKGLSGCALDAGSRSFEPDVRPVDDGPGVSHPCAHDGAMFTEAVAALEGLEDDAGTRSFEAELHPVGDVLGLSHPCAHDGVMFTDLVAAPEDLGDNAADSPARSFEVQARPVDDGPELSHPCAHDGPMFTDAVAELEGLDDSALDARLRLFEVQARRLEAHRAVALAEFERRQVMRCDGFASVVAWARGVLGWSARECRARMQVVRLIEAFPEVGDELLAGSLSVANVEALARAWANVRVRDRFGEFVGELLNQGSRLEHDDFRRVVDRFVMLADVDGAHRDRELSHTNRNANFVEFQGQGTLVAQWGDVDTALNQPIFDKFVHAEWESDWAWTVEQYGDDAVVALMPRTDAQRRADAMSAIIRRAGGTATAKGARVVTNIHVDWQNYQDLLAWAAVFPERAVDPFEHADTLVAQWRCETGDGMLIDPVAVLRASLEGYVRFVILNDQGVPIRWGRERRLFQGPARDAVMSLSPRCTHPGCRVPASRSEADHLRPWADGGRTEPSNGGPKCGGHNLFRTRGYASTRDRFGWHTYRPDGTEIC